MALLIVDGMSVLKSVSGQAAHLDRGYAYSFMIQVTAAVKLIKPVGVVVCWEGGHAKRTALLPDYKSDRQRTPSLMAEQRDQVKRLMTLLGADQFYAPGYEADDAIAYLANTLGEEVVIMSGDKDMLQLVSPMVSVYQKIRLAGVKSKKIVITPKNFEECTGWANPADYLKAHCALGDDVDRIPKLAGVGAPVVHAYMMGLDVAPAKKAKLDAFYADSPQYLLNRELICLTKVDDLELRRSAGAWDSAAAYRLLLELGFASITDKYDQWILAWEGTRLDADVSAVS